MHSRKYINDDLLSISIRNSNEALFTTDELCAWSPKPVTLTTQYNFFPVPKPRTFKSPAKSPKARVPVSSFKRRNLGSFKSPAPKNTEKEKAWKSFDEAEYKLLDLHAVKNYLPPLKLCNYNSYFKSAAKERTIEGFLTKCKEMIKETEENRMKSASPCKIIKKDYSTSYYNLINNKT